MGDWPGAREEFFDLSGKEIAAINGPEIKRLEHKDTLRFLSFHLPVLLSPHESIGITGRQNSAATLLLDEAQLTDRADREPPHYPASHEFNSPIRSHARYRSRQLILVSLGDAYRSLRTSLWEK